MRRFEGLWVPLVTPFDEQGVVDLAALQRLVRHLAEAGVHGFVVCGTTGEAAALTDEESEQVLRTVLEHAGGRPVMMGVGGITPDDVAAQCRRWAAFGIDGFLVPPPHYVRPTAQGVIDFYERVAAAAAPLPIIVYDIPYRTGVTLSLDTLRALASIPGVAALKDCGGDARKTQALIADGRLAVLAGEDAQVFTTLCQGGAGAITASAHLQPRHFVTMVEAVKAGRLAEARAWHHHLAPLVAALFAEPNPAPLKAVLATLGFGSATVRAPLTRASADVATHARAVHELASGPPLAGELVR
jgi:4-hydroxy-tetrahydrodipicolinate synthase